MELLVPVLPLRLASPQVGVTAWAGLDLVSQAVREERGKYIRACSRHSFHCINLLSLELRRLNIYPPFFSNGQANQSQACPSCIGWTQAGRAEAQKALRASARSLTKVTRPASCRDRRHKSGMGGTNATAGAASSNLESC